MFFDISAKSQVNTFSINENYAGLVLASDINRLSCSTDKNSMNDNIFSNQILYLIQLYTKLLWSYYFVGL